MEQINPDTLPRNRREAQALGHKLYFTGSPCKKGHLAERWTCNADCCECKKERDRKACSASWTPQQLSCLECGKGLEARYKPGRPAEFCSHECRTLAFRKYRLKWEASNPEARKRQVRNRLARHRRERTASYLASVSRRSQYTSRRRRLDPSFRLGLIMRNRLWNALSKTGANKSESALHLTGCSVAALRAHLESQFQPGMDWGNYGLYGWHIDHIIPCASFDLTDPEQQKACFHYTNLQPLWALDNIKKGASRS